ncbi:MAG: DUF1566 domain-containing protein [Treponema sp.]|nr:DUF1566 domain-containing protein [Treponema sp.]
MLRACSWVLHIGGYDDWFLPSIDELDLMFKNLRAKGLGEFGKASWYWSSSGHPGSNAWLQNFSDGFKNYYYIKNSSNWVRAVRAF